MGWQPNLQAETAFYAKHLLAKAPNAKVAVLYQNDDFGKDMLHGLQLALGDKAKTMIVDTQNFQATDPTIDSQLIALKASGADTLFLFTYAKQAAQAISKMDDLRLEAHDLSASRRGLGGGHLQASGTREVQGILTAGFMKDVTDPQWKDDADVKAWVAWMKENMPGAELSDILNAAGYAYAQTLEQVLRQAGDNLTRENIMAQAANLKNFRVGLLLPESRINTSPTDYRVINYMKLQRFNGTSWD